MVSAGFSRAMMNITANFQNLPVRFRLTLLVSMLVIGSGLALSTIGMQKYQQTIISQAINHLITIRESRIHDIREHIQEEMDDIEIFSSQPGVIKALQSFDHREFGQGTASAAFNRAEKLIGEHFSFYRQKFRFHDMMLISPAGHIFYTDVKEVDLGTSLISGKYRNSHLADVFRRSRFMLQTQVSSIRHYAPSDKDAVFISTPVFESGKVIGFIVVQLNLDDLSDVITSLTGLGDSGEVVAAKADGDSAMLVAPLRNAGSTKADWSIALNTERAKPLMLALQGNMSHASAIDYRGEEVEAAWGYIPELELGIVIKIDRSELLEPVNTLRQELIISAMIVLLLTIIIGLAFSYSLTRPIKGLMKSAQKFAQGQFDERSNVDSKDEIGRLADAFNLMAANIKKYNAQIRENNIELEAYGEELERRVEKRTATLAAANEEVKSFAYIVSHDLRAPLVNMKGFTGELDYALQQIAKKMTSIQSKLEVDERQELMQLMEEDIPESMQFITGAVERMDHMLASILQLSRLGRRDLVVEDIDLHALCSEILSSLAYQLEQGGSETVLAEMPVIRNDRLVMEQILGNLIGNAVKYLDPQRPGKIEIASAQTAAGITITVRDNGRGIQPQEVEKVFRIFRRGIHQDVQGEGMGLAYVQTLVRAQGGSIHFKPASEVGTVFEVFLPIYNKETRI